MSRVSAISFQFCQAFNMDTFFAVHKFSSQFLGVDQSQKLSFTVKEVISGE